MVVIYVEQRTSTDIKKYKIFLKDNDCTYSLKHSNWTKNPKDYSIHTLVDVILRQFRNCRGFPLPWSLCLPAVPHMAMTNFSGSTNDSSICVEGISKKRDCVLCAKRIYFFSLVTAFVNQKSFPCSCQEDKFLDIGKIVIKGAISVNIQIKVGK